MGEIFFYCGAAAIICKPCIVWCVNDAGQWLLEWGGAWRLFVLALDKPGMKVVTIKKYQFGCIGAEDGISSTLWYQVLHGFRGTRFLGFRLFAFLCFCRRLWKSHCLRWVEFNRLWLEGSVKWSVWADSLRSLDDTKARSYPGVPKHILGRLCPWNVLCGGSRVFSQCLICENAVCALFSARLETLFVYFFCCVGFADSACPMTFGRVATVQPKAVTLVHPLSSFVRRDVVPNAVNIKKHRLTPLERELEAVEGISLAERVVPHDSVAGTLSSTVVAVFRRWKLARQGAGGCRDLPWWTFGLFSKHRAGGPSFEVLWDQTSSGWGPHGGCQAKCHHFVGLWAVLREFWWWWSLCRQVCGAHGDCHAAAKLGGRDPLRLAQFLLKLEALQDIRNLNHGIQKIKMKWMRFCTAMGSAICTWGWWLYFSHIPI